jgi:hypothetical protein
MTFDNSTAFAPYNNIVKRRSSEDSTDEPMSIERTAKRTKMARQEAPSSPPQVHHYLTPTTNRSPVCSMVPLLFSSPVQHQFRAIPASQEAPLSAGWNFANQSSAPFGSTRSTDEMSSTATQYSSNRACW